MRVVALTLLVASGCESLLGLEQPVPRADGRLAADAHTAADGAESAIDAATPDSAPLVCPSGYMSIPGSGQPSSRYRLVATQGTFAAQRAACDADVPGATHLVSFNSATEAIAVISVFVQNGFAYVGGVQAPSQAEPDAGWFAFNGNALPATLWVTGQPDDEPTAAEDNAENVAIAENAGLHDADGSISYRAICECDGIPIDATVATYLP